MGDNSSSTWDVSQFIPLDVWAASSINKAANRSKTAKDMISMLNKVKPNKKGRYRDVQTYMDRQKPFLWQTVIHKVVQGWHQPQ
jgi:hypothetical protein